MNNRVLMLCLLVLLAIAGWSCRYVMPERYVDYNKGRVPVNLPRNAGNADLDSNSDRSNAVIVTVASDGKTYLSADHSPLDHDNLRFKVHELTANQPEDERMVYLAVDVDADYGAVVEACDAIRSAEVSRVGVLAFNPKHDWPARMTVELPPQPNPNQDLSQLRRNPFMLVATISPDLSVKLNQEPYGAVNDLGPLSTKLVELFRLRREQHAYREGYETRTDVPEEERVEKTIAIKANRIKFGDVAKVINALKGAGANPILLQLDDLPN